MKLPYKIEDSHKSSHVDLQIMAKVVSHSLMHLHLVSKNTPIDESFAKYPIVEYLERRPHCKNIQLETPLRSFYNRRIDLTFDDGDVKSAMEFKCFSGRSLKDPELQRIFNDIVRMYYAKTNEGYAKTYFLAFGRLPIIRQLFVSIESDKIPEVEGGQRTEVKKGVISWLSLKKDEDGIIIDNSTFKERLDEFGAKYIDKHREQIDNGEKENERVVAIDQNIRIQPILRTCSLDLTDEATIEDEYTTAIWEVCVP